MLALPDRAGSELATGNKGAITTVGNAAPVVVTPPVGRILVARLSVL
ncbi:hypothetical protein ACLQ18_02110 [Streptomyces sp. DT193]